MLFPDRVPDIEKLGSVLREQGVNTLWLTASLFNLIIDEAPQSLAGVRQLLVGGEELSVPHVERALERLPSTQLVNGYGPTENTTFSCCYRIPPDFPRQSRSVPIGRPIANSEAFVLDASRRPVPAGIVGEIYVGGDGLARGYRNRPALTAACFVSNPIGGRASDRLYRTGDLGRYLPSGDIEFLGRTDDQMKIRGFRIEPREIESVIARHPGVAQVAVAGWREAAGGDALGPSLVAYLVPSRSSSPSLEELRSLVAETLPSYMMPTDFVMVESIPLTPNGKVDRAALPPPAKTAAARSTPHTAPRDATEAQLVELWKKHLGLAAVSVRDNFFELGGHSLLAIRLLNAIRQALGVDLPVVTLFRAPTIERLSELVRNEVDDAVWSSLTALQPHGAGYPFFCVPGGGSDVIALEPLARYMGTQQPFYGLQYAGLDGRYSPKTNVEDMARSYLREIRQLQPAGPYFIGGSSGGGVVAFEMARLLRQQGQEVALVALLDAHGPGYPHPKQNLSMPLRAYELVRRTLLTEAATSNLTWAALSLGLRRSFELQRARIASWYSRLRQRALGHRYRYFALLAANIRANRQYACLPYDGKVVLFRTPPERIARTLDPDPTYGWSRFTRGKLTIVDIPGYHSAHINEPHVQVLASRLNDVIAQVAAAGAQPGGSYACEKHPMKDDALSASRLAVGTSHG